MKISNRILKILFGAAVACIFQATIHAQTLEKPSINNNPKVIKLPDLGIMDLYYGDTVDSVYVQIGNVGQADARAFVVRVSIKKKGETAKTYVEKRVFGLKAQTDLPLNINIGQPVKDLEIGIFLDAKKQVAESDEKNCGTIFPDGGVAGSQPCENF